MSGLDLTKAGKKATYQEIRDYVMEHTGLICNAPLEYADLVLNGDVEGYLKRVTQYRPLDEQE